MYISRLSLVNYRNFANTAVEFSPGVNTVIGENGAGKTNLFRALRLLLDQNMVSASYRLDEGDFHRGLGAWQGHWIIISAEFSDITPDESVQALFIHGAGKMAATPVDKATYNLVFRPRKEIRLRLSNVAVGDHAAMNEVLTTLTTDDYETVFMGRSTANFNDEQFYRSVVGDFSKAVFSRELDFEELGSVLPKQLAVSKEVSFSYIQALRDVVQEFQNNRANPLRSLLRSRSGAVDDADFSAITQMVRDLNSEIESLPDVATITLDIKNTIKDAVGEAYSPSSLTIKSDLPDDANRLFQSLKLFVGEDGEKHEGGIHELSLGGANLIYLTLKLLEFKYQTARQSVANFLLIEEPEAHIHNHIQKTLFDRLRYDDTQIIYSTHSTQISEVSNVDSMNILGREAGRCDAYQPSAGLTPIQISHVHRYLDAVRSNLLFARSVILVEGDAEEILIPVMIKKLLGLSLDELGISLINIRSTGFENVAILFADARIRKRCAIITDLDETIIDLEPNALDDRATALFRIKSKGSQNAGAARKIRLDKFVEDNKWAETFFAPHTFEVDFLLAGNTASVVNVVSQVYASPTHQTRAQNELEAVEILSPGRRILKMATSLGKGWFAILLAGRIDHQSIVPPYILEAVRFAQPSLTVEVWLNIFAHRLQMMNHTKAYSEADIRMFASELVELRKGDKSLADVQAQYLQLFADDRLSDFVGMF